MVAKRLEGIRDSKVGTALFYGYFVAILLTLYLVGFSILKLHQQDLKLRRQDARSCAAIKGAASFWQGERRSVNLLLTDHTLTNTTRTALAEYRVLLDKVISTSARLPCSGKEQPHG